jgi:hypothetical protein
MFLLLAKVIGCLCLRLVPKADGLVVLEAVMFNGKLERLAVGVELEIASANSPNPSKFGLLERHAKKLLGSRSANALG